MASYLCQVLTEVAQKGCREWRFPEPLRIFHDGDEPIGTRIWKRSENRRVHQRGDGRGCADSEPQREHDGGEECRPAQKCAGGVAKIL